MLLAKPAAYRLFLAGLGTLLVLLVIFAIGNGAVPIESPQVVAILLRPFGLELGIDYTDQQEAVMLAIRLPRVLLGLLVGSTLAVAGVALQGLFRNPMADPGLLGISSGASFFVAAAVVLQIHTLGFFTLPLAAFVGSALATIIISTVARENKKTNVTIMLLAGMAMSAFFMAGTGLFTYLSTDEQLRTITFWQMGSLAGATWNYLAAAAPFMLVCLIGIPFLAGALNALLLGEKNARYLGVSVERVKWVLIALIALGVGASVAVSGMIGFVGLVVPHIVRLFLGPNHRRVLPCAILVGSLLLLAADLAARTVAVPQELPIGLMTALFGAPFFLFLVLRAKKGSLA